MMGRNSLLLIVCLSGCGEADIEKYLPLPDCDSLVVQGAFTLGVSRHENPGLIARGSRRAISRLEIVGAAASTKVTAPDSGALHLQLQCPGEVGLQLIGEVAAADDRRPARYTKLALYGDSRFHAEQVVADCIDLRSAGDSALNIAGLVAGEALILASGHARIALGGEAQQVELRATGESEVDTLNLTAQRVTVSLGGASRVVLHATAHLDGVVTEDAQLTYEGSPDVSVETSQRAAFEPH